MYNLYTYFRNNVDFQEFIYIYYLIYLYAKYKVVYIKSYKLFSWELLGTTIKLFVNN